MYCLIVSDGGWVASIVPNGRVGGDGGRTSIMFDGTYIFVIYEIFAMW